MHRSDTRKWRAKTIACASILALSVFGFGASAQAQADPDKAVDSDQDRYADQARHYHRWRES